TAASRSWTPQPPRCAWTTTCPSSSSTSRARGICAGRSTATRSARWLGGAWVIQGAINDAKVHMQKTVDATRREVGSIRTGRATPALLERVTVEYYGVQTPINQVATVTAPDPRLLVVQPWDKSLLKDLERALLKSELGLVPSSDGALIRLPIPALTEE